MTAPSPRITGEFSRNCAKGTGFMWWVSLERFSGFSFQAIGSDIYRQHSPAATITGLRPAFDNNQGLIAALGVTDCIANLQLLRQFSFFRFHVIGRFIAESCQRTQVVEEELPLAFIVV